MTGQLVYPQFDKQIYNDCYLVWEFSPLKLREFQTQHLIKTIDVKNLSQLVAVNAHASTDFQQLKLGPWTQ